MQSSLTSIGEGTFSECSSLKKVSIPPSINSIINDVLKGFSSLIEISSPTPQKLKQVDQNHHQQTTRNMKSKEKISEIDECSFGLLLCGPGECGKTTIIHQLKSKFSEDEISDEEKLLYAQTIKANLIESMQKLIYWNERNDKEISSEFECKNYIIQKFIVASNPQTIDRPIIVFTQSSFDINQVIQNTEQFECF